MFYFQIVLYPNPRLTGSSFDRGFIPAVVETVFIGNSFQPGKLLFMRFVVNEGHPETILNEASGNGWIRKTQKSASKLRVSPIAIIILFSSS